MRLVDRMCTDITNRLSENDPYQVNSKEYENSEIQNNLNKEISRLNVRYLKQFIYIKFFIIINNKYVKASEQSLKINLEKEKNQVIQLKEEIIRLNQRLHETELLNDSTDNIQYNTLHIKIETNSSVESNSNLKKVNIHV